MATVIKASGPTHAIDGATYNLDDLGDRARQYLDQVRKQAADMLAQAQHESAAIRREAEEQGRAAGLAAAQSAIEEKMARQLTTLVPALRDAIERITAAKAEWLAHWEQMAVRVACAIAERVIRREVAQAPEITLLLVKEALELAAGSAEIQLRMHPDDLAALAGEVERLAGELSRLGKPRIVADPKIEIGGCRVDTRFGTIDQQFAAQLARIEQELT